MFTQVTSKQKQTDYIQQLQDAVTTHEPLTIDYKNIINPTEIGLSNPQELEKPRVRLTHEEKVAKYNTDKELRNIFNRHAYGLTEEKIFSSKQALNFFNMDIHEQKEQLHKWLKDHNVHQNNQLKEACKQYRQEIKDFKSTTQYDTLKNVAKIQRALHDRHDQIKYLKKKIEQGNLSTTDKQQKHQEIDRLKQQNTVDEQSIHVQLDMILDNLAEIDQKFKMLCDKTIQDYQQKNYEMLNAVNNIVTSKKQSFSLKTDDKHLPTLGMTKSQPRNNPEIAPMPKNPNSVILSETKETLANNPILDKIIERHEKDLKEMKKNNPDYSIMKEELAHLKKARNLRDIQGTAVHR
jgi:hypothetical protein